MTSADAARATPAAHAAPPDRKPEMTNTMTYSASMVVSEMADRPLGSTFMIGFASKPA